MRRSLDHVLRQCPVALVEIAKLVSNLSTLVLSLAFFVGVNAGAGDKDLKMKVIRKPS